MPSGGWIDLYIEQFSTSEDGCDAPIEYSIEREGCWTEIGGLLHGSGKSGMCAVICGSPPDCPDDQVCYGCPRLFTHSCGFFNVHHPLWGKGQFRVFHRGILIFSQNFDFGGGSDYFIMDFTDIEFLNKDYSQIQTNDIFDAMESVGIRVVAEFEGDEPAPAIGVVLRSDISQDTLVVDLPLEQVQWNTAIYKGLLPAGIFALIIGDPDEVLPSYSEAEISAEPVHLDCPGQNQPDVPVDVLPIANFQLLVVEISFESDHDLCKDVTPIQPGDPTTDPIIDPVWIRNSLNEPVAYTKNSSLLMDVKLICNRTPYHDFEYRILASGGQNQGNYITNVYEGHFYGTSVSMVENITPRDGAFPDYVGIIDPLVYNWWVNKTSDPNPDNFRFLNTSTHRIFLTYNTPLLEDVNVLGLDEMCDYAQGENVPAVIAELGVGGVYGEGWTYDQNHDIFFDPLNVVRQQIGQCVDYANLMTHLYKCIGIDANSTVVYNGAQYGLNEYWLFWIYSGNLSLPCLLTNTLTSCNGVIAKWQFGYHAVTRTTGLLCDAAFGIAVMPQDYAVWWEYYLQPAEYPDQPVRPDYTQDTPPVFEPTYYDWEEYAIPIPPWGIMPPYIIPTYPDWFCYPCP